MKPSVSIVIPALNEAGAIGEVLAGTAHASSVERIVVDGGSRDGTSEIAASCGARVIESPVGRARQMNAGAAASGGQYLLFLHADTVLPVGFEALVHLLASQPGFAAGAFTLRIDGPAPGLRLIETVANWRARFLGLPYGDQAYFLRADLFSKLGGYAEIPILEDFDLIRRARRWGRIEIVPHPVLTSARRWEQTGIWKTTLRNQLAVTAYCLGFSPRRIAQWYHGNSAGR